MPQLNASVVHRLTVLALSLTAAFGATVAQADDASAACAQTTVLHIAPDSETPFGDGSSWSAPASFTAALGLANANTVATQCFELRLKQGLYKPHASDVRVPFNVTRPMQIKGGYTGNPDQPDERELIARNTVLSGDIDNNDPGTSTNGGITAQFNDISGDNSQELLVLLPSSLPMSAQADTAAYTLIEGLTITGAWYTGLFAGDHQSASALSGLHLRHLYFAGNTNAFINEAYSNGTLVLSHSTFAGNINAVEVSARRANTRLTTISHSSFDHNTGHAIYNHAEVMMGASRSTIEITHSTITNHTAPPLENHQMDNFGEQDQATIRINGSILWNPYASALLGPISDGTTTISNSIVNGGWNGGDNIITADPELGDLEDNGGPTWTRLPRATSPALDAVDCSASGSLVTSDQRGGLRPINGACDLGAVEAGQSPSQVSAQPSLNGSLSCPAWRPDTDNTVTCTATPASGYHTVSMSGCGGATTGVGVNSYTTGALSDACTVSATFAADATAPDAPTLSSAAAGDGSVTLTWTAPANNGGSAITGYTVTGAPSGTCSGDASATSCTITGLTNGTEYSFSVVATNAVGDSLASNAVTATPSEPSTVPDAPTALSATPGDGAVTLTWAAPANNGGSAITGYTVTGTPGGTCTGDASATSCTVSGLTNGTAYSFSVVATNALGDSVASNVVTATPLAPPTVLPIPGGNGSASVQISGGPNTCAVVPNSLSINSSPPDAPAGAVFPMGVLHFEANGCANATLTVNITYSSPIPDAAVPHKYGPPSAGAAPSWFVPSAVTMSNDRRTVSFTVTDNGEGDNNLTLGQIRDPFGPVILASGVAAVPTLAQWGVMLLSVLTAALGAGALRSRRVRHT